MVGGGVGVVGVVGVGGVGGGTVQSPVATCEQAGKVNAPLYLLWLYLLWLYLLWLYLLWPPASRLARSMPAPCSLGGACSTDVDVMWM